jgi:hypothetical protein
MTSTTIISQRTVIRTRGNLMSDMLTIRAAAVYMGLSERTVRSMCAAVAPQLEHVRIGPRRGRIMIARAECDRHLREGLVMRGRPEAEGSQATKAAARPYRYKFLEPSRPRRPARPSVR